MVLVACCATASARAQEEHPLPNLGTAVLQNRMMTQRWYGLEEQLKMRALDKKALAHAAAWREGERAPDPVAGREGRVVFRFGPSTRIVCA
ncbi:MAG TPA: hypothetical protein VFX59_06130, partial [Polyangiales bacterium]|nr:hypothetical protein [Polyangiales bacterium]